MKRDWFPLLVFRKYFISFIPNNWIILFLDNYFHVWSVSAARKIHYMLDKIFIHLLSRISLATYACGWRIYISARIRPRVFSAERRCFMPDEKHERDNFPAINYIRFEIFVFTRDALREPSKAFTPSLPPAPGLPCKNLIAPFFFLLACI